MMVTEESFWQQQEKRGVVLNQVQRDAVLQNKGALLLLAAPGSGKTTTLLMKIGYLIAVKGLAPQRIKAVTFSRAAAAEMKERFKGFFPQLASVDFSTIHSLAFTVVRDYFRRQNIAYELIEGRLELGKGQILRDIFKNLTQENITEDQMDELMTYISFIKNRLIARAKWSEVECSVKKAAEILTAYETFKSSSETLLLDYDDMLLYANKALDEDTALLAKYQNLYDYVLTDESQDTSLVQHYIIEKLVRRHGCICVVADDDQSIYSWRGADPAYLLRFRDIYPKAQILYMEENYRSSREIVAAANQFIQRNKQRYSKKMFTKNLSVEPIRLCRLNDYKQQAKYLIEAIKDASKDSKIAILYRNSSSAIILINELERAGLAFAMKDEDKRFFSHWVVADILNFMRLTYTDKRIDIFEKVFAKMNGYITKQQLESVRRLDNHQSVFTNLLRHAPLHDYQMKPIAECQAIIASMNKKTPLAAIAAIRHKLGYEKALDRMCDRLGFRKEALIGVLNTLEEIAAGLGTMEEFANRLTYLETIAKEAKARQDSLVTLSTFHSAKGLEFDSVYMIDLVEGIVPSASDVEQKEQGNSAAMEEAVRLFYVAMTRARRRLELITYEKREQVKVKESQFVTAVRCLVEPPVKNAQGYQKFSSNQSSPSYSKQGKLGYGSQRYQSSGNVSTSKAPPKPVKVLSPTAIRRRDELQVGKLVSHSRFGQGKITALTAVSMDIQFADKMKTLALDVCLEQGFLEPVR